MPPKPGGVARGRSRGKVPFHWGEQEKKIPTDKNWDFNRVVGVDPGSNSTRKTHDSLCGSHWERFGKDRKATLTVVEATIFRIFP